MIQRVLALLLVLGSFAFVATPVAAQTHKDERLGFQIRVPKKWTQIPMQSREQWVVAKFASDKIDYYTRTDLGYTLEHTPTIRIVAFIDQFINAQDLYEDDDDEESEEKKEEEGKDQSKSAPKLDRVYRDYAEFMKENFDGGYYVTEETATKVGKIPVEVLTIRAEDDSGSNHRLLMTWIYELDYGKVAVEFELLEDTYEKKKSTIEKTLKSFKEIERTIPLAQIHDDSNVLSLWELDELEPAERAERKKAAQAQVWEAAKRNLPDGWTSMTIDDVRVLTRYDEKHAKTVVLQIQAVMAWLEDTFPEIGPEEYVRIPIIRICKDYDEERQFRQGSARSSEVAEIVTRKDEGGADGNTWDYLNSRAMRLWFYEKDGDLSFVLPGWLQTGMEFVIRSSKVKGKKLKFQKGFIENLGKIDDVEPWGLERVMKMSNEEFMDSMGDGIRPIIQATALARFFISGAGSKGQYKGVLEEYIGHARAIAEEMSEEALEELVSDAETEEEEEEEIKARKAWFEKRERKVLEEAYARTFGSWPDKKLTTLKKAYLKEVK
jgi:hypothetical protein